MTNTYANNAQPAFLNVDACVLSYAVSDTDLLSLPNDPSFDPERVLDLWKAAMHIMHDPDVAMDNHKKQDARNVLGEMSIDVRRRLAEEEEEERRKQPPSTGAPTAMPEHADAPVGEGVHADPGISTADDGAQSPSTEQWSDIELTRPTSPVAIDSQQQEGEALDPAPLREDAMDGELYTSARPTSPLQRMRSGLTAGHGASATRDPRSQLGNESARSGTFGASSALAPKLVPKLETQVGVAPWMRDEYDDDEDLLRSATAPFSPTPVHPQQHDIDVTIHGWEHGAGEEARDRLLEGGLRVVNPDVPEPWEEEVAGAVGADGEPVSNHRRLEEQPSVPTVDFVPADAVGEETFVGASRGAQVAPDRAEHEVRRGANTSPETETETSRNSSLDISDQAQQALKSEEKAREAVVARQRPESAWKRGVGYSELYTNE
ncbi:hypothetical protein LTR85_002237 [Meristemomyces frigidus]|nr:hypothetical protein LTR85_002237 [Meristemomyces frigidus]